MTASNSFGSLSTLKAGGREFQFYRLGALTEAGFDLRRIPYSIKVPRLENLLRQEDGAR